MHELFVRVKHAMHRTPEQSHLQERLASIPAGAAVHITRKYGLTPHPEKKVPVRGSAAHR